MNTQIEDLDPDREPGHVSITQQPLEPPSTIHKIFFGADGLRAGWSLLLFVAMVAALAVCVNFALRKLGVPHPQPGAEVSPWSGIVSEGGTFLIVLFVTWIMSKVERRPNGAYGLGGRHPAKLFIAGLGWGFLCLSLLVFSLWRTGLLVIDGRLLSGGSILRYGALWLLAFTTVGLLEEYLTRGYLQYTLARGLAGIYRWVFKSPHSAALGFWTSAIIFSVLFGLGHSKNPGESPIGLLSAGLVGLVFCFSLWRTGSLWWAIGFHASWDWAQSFVYGVADSGLVAEHHLLATHPVGIPLLSGGATGPEGSIFILGVMLLIILIIFFTLPRRNDETSPFHGETTKPQR